jgi:hypothetical protein
MQRFHISLLAALLLPTLAALHAQPAKINGPIAPDGTELALELPTSLNLKNKGGSDGAGLCVFTSISHSARWQNVQLLSNFRDWMTRYPGGGWPQRVDQMIAHIAAEQHISKPAYVQVTGSDLDVLRLAVKTGRMPGVTYSRSPTGRYGGQRISHMVSLVHASNGGYWAILDNNYPGTIEWMSEKQFRQTYTAGQSGWAVILLNPGPPPIPTH